MFAIPHIFNELDIEMMTWSGKEPLEEFIIDNRSDLERRAAMNSSSLRTFRLESDLWQEKPQLISSEEVEDGSFHSAVFHLEQFN